MYGFWPVPILPWWQCVLGQAWAPWVCAGPDSIFCSGLIWWWATGLPVLLPGAWLSLSSGAHAGLGCRGVVAVNGFCCVQSSVVFLGLWQRCSQVLFGKSKSSLESPIAVMSVLSFAVCHLVCLEHCLTISKELKCIVLSLLYLLAYSISTDQLIGIWSLLLHFNMKRRTNCHVKFEFKKSLVAQWPQKRVTFLPCILYMSFLCQFPPFKDKKNNEN